MDDLERKRLEEEIEALLHGAEDMIDATVAAEWLREIDDPIRARVLRTAMVVSYARIFSKAKYKLDRDAYRPTDAALADLHHRLICHWRNKVYAHTDKASRRTATITATTATTGRIIEWTRYDFPMAQVDEALTLFDLQRKRFEDEAESLRRLVDGVVTAS
jgi:aminopeptidase N